MKKALSILVATASLALVVPFSFMPNAASNCADSSWQFRASGTTQNHLDAAADAREFFCIVVDSF